MIPIRDLFESHLTVGDLKRSMAFFSEVLGLTSLVSSRSAASPSTGSAAEGTRCSACGKSEPFRSD